MNFLSRCARHAGARFTAPIVLASLFGAVVSCNILGCGMAASPQPPSLQLPKPVHDLTAARVGNQICLHWITPSETTDKLKLRGPVRFEVCSKEKAGACQTVATLSATPGAAAEYTQVLPPSLTTGALRPITYEILSLNQHHRNAGPSNPAVALAGEPPPRIEHLSATMIERGVLLHWQTVSDRRPGTVIELQRTLLTPVTQPDAGKTGLPAITEPAEVALEVSPGSSSADPGTTLDTGANFDRKYRYVASRVVRQKSGEQMLRVAGPPSEPVIFITRDTFPPAAPKDLAAIPLSSAMNNGIPEVDLSWSANTESDFAQYLVYRRQENASPDQSSTEQIGPKDITKPIVAPIFRDFHIQAGSSYVYYVLAVDRAGNRSAKSAEVRVTVPAS